MTRNSKECREALANYKVENEIEKVAIVLLRNEYESCDDMDFVTELFTILNCRMDELVKVIEEIRNNIGLKEEA